MTEYLPQWHWTNLLIIPGLLVAFSVHELAHAFTAYFLGDPSQVTKGKLTLNPLRHISWLGALLFLLIGIGWAKPLELDSSRFKSRYMGVFLVAIAGPLASLFFTLVTLFVTSGFAAGLILISGESTEHVVSFLFPQGENLPLKFNWQAAAMALTYYMIVANFGLLITSLIPLPGLDAFVALVSLYTYFRRPATPPVPSQPVPFRNARVNDPPTPISQDRLRNNAADIHFKIGTEYHLTQQYDDAVARYRQAIANDEKFGPAYVNLGLAYLAKGKRREAIHAFRGAVQNADDEKARQEGWLQLHRLSEVSPVAEDAAASMARIGKAPWTDTKLRPNWLTLGLGSGLLLLGSLIVYGYLFANLLLVLQA
jgi:Zn-dependent protease